MATLSFEPLTYDDIPEAERPSLAQALVPVVGMLVFLSVGVIWLGLDPQLPLLWGIILTGTVGRYWLETAVGPALGGHPRRHQHGAVGASHPARRLHAHLDVDRRGDDSRAHLLRPRLPVAGGVPPRGDAAFGRGHLRHRLVVDDRRDAGRRLHRHRFWVGYARRDDRRRGSDGGVHRRQGVAVFRHDEPRGRRHEHRTPDSRPDDARRDGHRAGNLARRLRRPRPHGEREHPGRARRRDAGGHRRVVRRDPARVRAARRDVRPRAPGVSRLTVYRRGRCRRDVHPTVRPRPRRGRHLRRRVERRLRGHRALDGRRDGRLAARLRRSARVCVDDDGHPRVAVARRDSRTDRLYRRPRTPPPAGAHLGRLADGRDGRFVAGDERHRGRPVHEHRRPRDELPRPLRRLRPRKPEPLAGHRVRGDDHERAHPVGDRRRVHGRRARRADAPVRSLLLPRLPLAAHPRGDGAVGVASHGTGLRHRRRSPRRGRVLRRRRLSERRGA
ncbi:Na+/H+ antiporter NhaC, partial [Haloferax sp. BAB-2207]